MPKRIKTEEISPRERTNAKLAAAALAAALAFGGTFTALLSVLGKMESDAEGSPIAAAVSCCFLVYMILLLVHCIHGFITFEKQEHYGVLMTSVLTAFSAFTALLNAQFMTAMFLTAIKLDDAAKKVIGGRSFEDFIAGQRTSWILLIFGVAAAMVAGLSGIVKLGKNMNRS